MRVDRHLAVGLRKGGKSYNEISKELGVSKSTLSIWFKDNVWSGEIKRDLIKKAQIKAVGNLRVMAIANKLKWANWHEQCRIKANNEFEGLKNNLLFVSGLMLYWGEGDKVVKNGVIRMVNSDPAMMKIFYKFLIEVLKVPRGKIFVRLTLYPDLDDSILKPYWGNLLGIPLNQFHKSSVIIGKHPEKILSFGVCTIGVCSRELKEKIFAWIELYKDYFKNAPTMSYNT